jgi:hypothetical protein
MKPLALPWLMLALGAGLLGGCGPRGPVTFPLSGSVTWNGKPVPAGLVRLVPNAEAGNPGPAAVAEIMHGHYTTPAGKGIIGGKYRVFISGYDGVPLENKEEGTGYPLGRALFFDRLHEVEFPREATTRDFHLTEK